MGNQITLRPYQTTGVNDIRSAINQGYKSILYCSPCGSGKTTIMKYIAYNALLRGNSTIFTVHRKVLLDQASDELNESEIPHGIIASGKTMIRQKVMVASIKTLKRRLDRITGVDILVLDECSHATAGEWLEVIKAFPNAVKIGLTATPTRLSGKPLSDIFDTMILGPSVKDLILQRYLSKYEIYGPPNDIDFSDIKKTMGDYEKGKLEVAIEKSTIVGSAVDHYKKLLSNERAIVFCVSIKASERTAERFRNAGVTAVHLDGTTPKIERRKIIQDFKNNVVNVLVNVDIIAEGFNVPAVKGIHCLRPTMSLALDIQQKGRALRPKPDGSGGAIIYDHVGNYLRHNLPDYEHQWTLEGISERVSKKENEPLLAVRTCHKCFAVYKACFNKCPHCGTEYELTTRELKEVEGQLEKVEAHRQWVENRREQGTATDLAGLVAVGKKRGYKNAYYWAKCVLASRKKKADAKSQRKELQLW